MSNDDSNTVVELCSNLVREHFEKYPFHEPFALEDFRPPKKGLLADFVWKDLAVPIPKDPFDPTIDAPCLLLHDLENPMHTKSAVYQFIDSHKDGCAGLYGTSGAGKTCSAFEYLSHNFGLYFVASTKNDAGSRDLERLISDIF
jgi:hypothetical protein